MSSSDKKYLRIIFMLGTIFVLCVTGWLYFVFYGDSDRAWRAMLINFIFFTPLATGMIVWPAIAIASRGTWAKPLTHCLSALYFAPVSIAFIALWIGQSLGRVADSSKSAAGSGLTISLFSSGT
jgi:hypothetical protein